MSDEPVSGDPDEAWLMDGTGAPSTALSRAAEDLSALGARSRAAPPPRAVPAGPRAFAPLAAAAALLVAVAAGSFSSRPSHDPADDGRSARDLWVYADDGAGIPIGDWIDAESGPREIELGDLSRVSVAAKSRVQLRWIDGDETRLYLERGRIEAFVSADARPRFFQVDTDAARCVDLGCRYTLEADGAGRALVRVTVGQVAFEEDGREVYVPAGARCAASADGGAGTPRFEDADPALHAAFDAYDRAVERDDDPAARESRAVDALRTVRSPRDTLPAWHVAQREGGAVAAAALRVMREVLRTHGDDEIRLDVRPDHHWR